MKIIIFKLFAFFYYPIPTVIILHLNILRNVFVKQRIYNVKPIENLEKKSSIWKTKRSSIYILQFD